MADPYIQTQKLVVGSFDTSVASLGSLLGLKSGTLVNCGVSYFGASIPAGVDLGTVTIGPPVAIPGVGSIPNSLNVLGISNFVGVTNHIGDTNTIGISKKLGISMKLAADISAALKVCSGFHITTDSKVITGNLNVTNKISCGTISAFYGAFQGVAAPFKQFDIPHPNKEGYRLVHACLEGPEIGVYYRGRLERENTIKLPDYWNGLVHPGSITVNLTPHKVYQELFVKSMNVSKITVVNNSGGPIDCSYVVYAERLDIDKLIIEQKEVEK